MFYQWRPYVPVAVRRANALRKMEKLRKKGQPVSPVKIEGRTIASTFWGKSWCDNLEGYSDFSNRLPRGRTYVRNGSVVDLQIEPGDVKAYVSGSELYRVHVKVSEVPKARWAAICKDCTGAIDSVVELLQGRFAKGVMERLCQQKAGLFPAPAEIKFECSCPDWASMCKHVAAVLYGVGARLDERPELLFRLRKVTETDLLTKVGKGLPLSKRGPAAGKVLDDSGLGEMFGLEMAEGTGVDAVSAAGAASAEAESKADGREPLAPGKPAARKRGRPTSKTSATSSPTESAAAPAASPAKPVVGTRGGRSARRGAEKAAPARTGRRGRPAGRPGEAPAVWTGVVQEVGGSTAG
ncbi:MAG: hypothetical protein HYZ53_03595 [Planctomycetes bacterium]|nr:hypothetical protein [Planctomycetota bacterium]